jgi:16S rRNA (guanine527-N7)-methyltransferase
MSDAAPEPLTQAAFQSLTGIDDAAQARLQIYAETLADWNSRMNLVSPNSLTDLWRRHMLDSAQLVPLIPTSARRHIDIGSGAGFPGLVIAALLGPGVGLETTLIEATEKKCVFLRAAADAMGIAAHVTVLRGRAEEVKPEPADVVTARAVAPLVSLLFYARRLVAKGGLCLFPKGRTALDELTEARRSWTIRSEMVPSRSDASGAIVLVHSFAPKGRRS